MRLAIGIFIVAICLLYGGSLAWLVWTHHTDTLGVGRAPSPVMLVVLVPGFALGVWLIVSALRKPRAT
ncbi:MAG TPA: hypothetical protein VGF50_01170 [Caulobacteraceae bacterium]|jgi:hypothetical protein